MITFDKEKMKKMLDEVLVPEVEKHSKILDEIIEKRPDYLIQIELKLISDKLEKLIKKLDIKSIDFNECSKKVIDVSSYQSIDEIDNWHMNQIESETYHFKSEKNQDLFGSRKNSFNMEKIA